MKSWFQHLKQRWENWCGDRDMEIAIRKHMTDSGFYGQSAKIQNVRLLRKRVQMSPVTPPHGDLAHPRNHEI